MSNTHGQWLDRIRGRETKKERVMAEHGRLIDADALWMDIIHSMDYCDDILEIIERQPTIEPERKKGKWKQVEVSYLGNMDADIKESMAIASMFCPVCKRYHNEVYLYGSPTDMVKFCSNCGADMRQEGESDG